MKRFLIACCVTSLMACTFGPSESQSAARTVTASLESGGLTRTYRLHVPAVSSSKALPLVLALNGRGGTGQQLSGLTQFDALADREGFIVAYPDGFQKSWADGRGGTPADKAGVDDVAFISSLIERLSGQFRIDAGRVYAFGVSNGGHMSQRLACALSGRIVAIGVVAATMGERLARGCQPKSPVSVLLIHGTTDPLSPYGGGDEGGDRGVVLSAEATVTDWAGWNACNPKPTVTALPDVANDRTRVERRVFDACKSGSEVAFYRIENGGHTWPGGPQYLPELIIGKTSKDMDASAVIWAFFARFSRP